MILNMTTQDFSGLGVRAKKKIFKDFVGCKKLDEIVFGSMTNGELGEYKVRHDHYAYSLIKVFPSACGRTELEIYNYRTKEWQKGPSL
jgi:hypothetical protein